MSLSRRAVALLAAAALVVAAVPVLRGIGGVGAEGGGSTTVTGATDTGVPLTIEPAGEGAVSSVNVFMGEVVFFIQKLPATRVVDSVTIGDLESTDACMGQNVGLSILESDSGNYGDWHFLTGGSAFISVQSGRKTFAVTQATMTAGKGYALVLDSGAYAPCSVLNAVSWEHAGATVNGGSAACAQYHQWTYGYGISRRYWHVQGQSDVNDQCAAGYPVAPSNFEASMPTGWLSVYKPSSTGPLIPTNQAGSSATCPSTHEEHFGQAVTWPEGSGVVCMHTSFGAQGEEVPNGWFYAILDGYYGHANNHRAVRELYVKLEDTTGTGTGGDPQASLPTLPTAGVMAGDGNSGAPNLACSVCAAADPINSASGNHVENETDLSVAGRGAPLGFERSYNSLFNNDTGASYGRLGAGWSGSWSMHLDVPAGTENGELAVVHNDNGSKVPFKANTNGTYTAPGFVTAALRKVETEYVYELRDTTKYTFSSGGLLREVDDRGYVTTVAHDENGRITEVTNEAGRKLQFTYDADGHLKDVTDPLGRKVSYTYTDGNLATVTDVGGGVTHYGYDEAHRLTSVTDPLGHAVVTEYDELGRAVRQTDAEDQVTLFAYGENQTTITDPRGIKTKLEFSSGQVTKKTEALGTGQERTLSYEYDADRNMVKRSDGRGAQFVSTYDATGDMLSRTDPLGRTTSYEHDPVTGRVVKTTDPLGVATTKTYDSVGNLTHVRRPLVGTEDVATTRYVYDPGHPGQVTAKHDPSGRTYSFAYDTVGNLTAVTDGEGNTTTDAYNALGWRTQTVSPRGNRDGANPADFRTRYEYDDYGRLIRTTDRLGRSASSVFDAVGNLTRSTDPQGRVTTFSYDDVNRAISTTRPDDTRFASRYDAAGNVVAFTDGRGQETRFAYDALGRQVTQTDPLDRDTRYSYDDGDRRTSMRDAKGETTTYTYDQASQLTKLEYSDSSTADVTFTYDLAGRRTAMTDATGTSTTTWDSLDRVRQTTSPPVIGAPISEALVSEEQLDYDYDLAGRLTKISYPALVGRVATITGPDGAPIYVGGRPTVSRRYDDAGLLVEVDDFKARRFLFEYDADGNLTKQTNPNFTVTALSYDNGGQLTRSNTTGPNGELLDLPYTYNAGGQLATSSATAALGGVGQSYSYDTLNRLVEAKLPSGQGTDVSRQHFTYDAADRITTLGTGPVDAKLAYDNAAQLTKATEALTGTQLADFSYDANGNRTKLTDPAGSTVAYGYDQADRLVRYRNSGSTTATTIGSHAAASLTTTTAADVTYRYNGSGLRADLLWDQSLGMPLILADATHLYITGPGGLPLEQVDLAGNALWYHHDQLGSTRALSNQDGHRIATSDYDAYGRPIKPVDNAVEPFGFAGQYTDRQSGLIYMRARWYDPSTGQFLTRDPLGLSAGQNPYHYASNDPVNRIDPSGLLDCDLDEVLGAIAQEVAIGVAIAGATAIYRSATSGSLAGTMTAVAIYEVSQVAAHAGGLAARALAKLQTKLANRALARAARRRATSTVDDLLRPGGSLIGKAGSDATIREITGGLPEAQAMFQQLTQGGKVVAQSAKLTRVELPDGGFVQLRTVMSNSPTTAATIDVNIPGYSITKLKYNP